MTLQQAEFTVHEFEKMTVIQSAEVVPNIDGDYSVLVTAIFRDLSIAAKALGIFSGRGKLRRGCSVLRPTKVAPDAFAGRVMLL